MEPKPSSFNNQHLFTGKEFPDSALVIAIFSELLNIGAYFCNGLQSFIWGEPGPKFVWHVSTLSLFRQIQYTNVVSLSSGFLARHEMSAIASLYFIFCFSANRHAPPSQLSRPKSPKIQLKGGPFGVPGNTPEGHFDMSI